MSAPARPALTIAGLPPLDVRPARLSDADAIYRLTSASSMAVIGDPDTTLEETASDLQDAGLDLASDTTLVMRMEAEPTAVAYALAYDEHETHAMVDVYLDPVLEDAAFTHLGELLVAWTLDRVRVMLRDSGRTFVKVTSGSYGSEWRQRTLLERAGFSAERVYHRMRVQLTDRAPRPPLPTGVTVRLLDLDDESDRRLAHRLTEEPFTEHHGYTPTTYERFWELHRHDDPVLDPTAWWLAEVDGAPAGCLIGDETRAADGGGFIPSLGVLSEHRGRGVARALLHAAFDDYAARGRDWVALAVDSENATGATTLYESVGMKETAAIVLYSRDVVV